MNFKRTTGVLAVADFCSSLWNKRVGNLYMSFSENKRCLIDWFLLIFPISKYTHQLVLYSSFIDFLSSCPSLWSKLKLLVCLFLFASFFIFCSCLLISMQFGYFVVLIVKVKLFLQCILGPNGCIKWSSRVDSRIAELLYNFLLARCYWLVWKGSLTFNSKKARLIVWSFNFNFNSVCITPFKP